MTKTITVAAVAGNDVEGHARAIVNTLGNLPRFAEVILFSPTFLPGFRGKAWRQIPDWGTDRRIYEPALSKFILHELHRHITTDFVILVQADGYAVNRAAWTDEFLNYDFIGAPMPWWECLCIKGRWNRRVGSGGFSLRSRRFLDLSARLRYNGTVGEDIFVSRVKHRYFEQFGCCFAPVPLALRWCMEHRLEDYRWNPDDSFGQHGFAIDGQRLHRLTPIQAFANAYRKRLHR